MSLSVLVIPLLVLIGAATAYYAIHALLGLYDLKNIKTMFDFDIDDEDF